MIKVRDVKYKIVGSNILFGIELEPEEWNYYKNSEAKLNLLKDGNVVYEEKIIIPTIATKDLLYLGKSISYVPFDDIDIDLKLGSTEYETSYYENVIFEMDQEKTNGRHLEYKLTNNTDDTFQSVSLNLIFYNRGELVCGTDIKMDNLLNGRTYYFTYDVPEEILYTDISTRLVLPNTNELLFRGFYEKCQSYIKDIQELSTPKEPKQHEIYKDPVPSLKKEIEKNKNELKAKKKIKIKNFPTLFIENIKALSWNFVEGALCGIGYGIALFVIIMVLFIINSSNPVILYIDSHFNEYTFFFFLWFIPSCITFLIRTIKDLSIQSIKNGTFLVNTKNYKTYEEKQKILNDLRVAIIKCEKDIEFANKNIEKQKQEIVEKNLQMDKENEKLEELNQMNLRQAEKLQIEFEHFKAKYPEYRVIETYDKTSLDLVAEAISYGAITFEHVENYRIPMLRQIEEQQRFEREMKVKEEQNRLLAEQNRELSLDRAQRMQAQEEMLKQQQSAAFTNQVLMQEQLRKIQNEFEKQSLKNQSLMYEMRYW